MTFNMIDEHRHWCPWITPSPDSPVTDKESSDNSTSEQSSVFSPLPSKKYPGWRVILATLLPSLTRSVGSPSSSSVRTNLFIAIFIIQRIRSHSIFGSFVRQPKSALCFSAHNYFDYARITEGALVVEQTYQKWNNHNNRRNFTADSNIEMAWGV